MKLSNKASEELVNGELGALKLASVRDSVPSELNIVEYLDSEESKRSEPERYIISKLQERYERSVRFTNFGKHNLVVCYDLDKANNSISRTLNDELEDLVSAQFYNAIDCLMNPFNLSKDIKNQTIIVKGINAGKGVLNIYSRLVSYFQNNDTRKGISSTSEVGSCLANAFKLLIPFTNTITTKDTPPSTFTGIHTKLDFNGCGQLITFQFDLIILNRFHVSAINRSSPQNFHILYLLVRDLSVLNSQLALSLKIETFTVSDFKILGSNLDKGQLEYSEVTLFGLQNIMRHHMGFNDENIEHIYTILACILHLGNIEYTHRSNREFEDLASLYNTIQFTCRTLPVADIAALLGIGGEKALTSFLLRNNNNVKRIDLHSKVLQQKILDGINCQLKRLISYLYEKILWCLIDKINSSALEVALRKTVVSTSATRLNKSGTINIIAVPPYQDNEINNFDQLAVNYLNDVLNYQIIKAFHDEATTWETERLEPLYPEQIVFSCRSEKFNRLNSAVPELSIGYNYLLSSLSLLSQKNTGLLEKLDKYSLLRGPMTTTEENDGFNLMTLLRNGHKVTQTPSSLGLEYGFVIHHYGKASNYNLATFAERNKLEPFDEVANFIQSQSQFNWFQSLCSLDNSSSLMKGKSTDFLSTRLGNMISNLEERYFYPKSVKSEVKCIHCIKAKSENINSIFDVALVKKQLEQCGMLQVGAILFRQFTFSVYLEEFIYQFAFLSHIYKIQYTSPSEAHAMPDADLITRANELASKILPEQYFIVTKDRIIMVEVCRRYLDNLNKETHLSKAIKLQTWFRRYLTREIFLLCRFSAIVIQKNIRRFLWRCMIFKIMKANYRAKFYYRGLVASIELETTGIGFSPEQMDNIDVPSDSLVFARLGNTTLVELMVKIRTVQWLSRSLFKLWRRFLVKRNLSLLQDAINKNSISLIEECRQILPQYFYIKDHNQKFQTARHIAVTNGILAVVELLDISPIDVIEPDIDGNTLVHCISPQNPSLDILKYIDQIMQTVSVDRNNEKALMNRHMLFSASPKNTRSLLKVGWLWKQNSSNQWQKRWFILVGDSLRYYKTSVAMSADNPCDSFPMNSSFTVVHRMTLFCEGIDNSFVVELFHKHVSKKGRTRIVLKADSRENFLEWIKALSICSSTPNDIQVRQVFDEDLGDNKKDYVNSSITKLFLSAVNNIEDTPLHRLAKCCLPGVPFIQYLRLAAWLIENGVQMLALNKAGQSALELAVEDGNIELATFLLQRGADITQLNERIELPKRIKSSLLKDSTVKTSYPRLNEPFKMFGYTYLSLYFEDIILDTATPKLLKALRKCKQPFMSIFVQRKDKVGLVEAQQDLTMPFPVVTQFNQVGNFSEGVGEDRFPNQEEKLDENRETVVLHFGQYWHMQTAYELLESNCQVVFDLKNFDSVTKVTTTIASGLIPINANMITTRCAECHLKGFKNSPLSRAVFRMQFDVLLSTRAHEVMASSIQDYVLQQFQGPDLEVVLPVERYEYNYPVVFSLDCPQLDHTTSSIQVLTQCPLNCVPGEVALHIGGLRGVHAKMESSHSANSIGNRWAVKRNREIYPGDKIYVIATLLRVYADKQKYQNEDSAEAGV